MSVTFEAMLIFELPDRDGMADLNRRLYEADTERHQQFNRIDMDHAGGTKFFTTEVWAACFNHFTPSDVEDCIAATQWRYPEWIMYVEDLGDYHYSDYGDDKHALSARRLSDITAPPTGGQRD